MVEEKQAQKACDKWLKYFSIKFGGQMRYIHSVQRIRRTKAVNGWCIGRTIRQLPLDFDLTERQVYNIGAEL